MQQPFVCLTAFLLGVVKDNAGDSWPGRSVSWDESSRLSRTSSRSRDTPSGLSRDTPSRLDRYGERYESPAPSRFETPSREPPRYDSERYETPARRDVPTRYDSPARFDTLSRRDAERFDTPDRERLPQRSQTSMGSIRRVPVEDIVSPSPAARPRMSLDAPRDEPEPRARERHQTLPPLSISKATLPKPLPTLPSEGGTVGRRRRTLTSVFNPTAPGPTTALSVTTDALTRTPSSSSKGDDKEKSTDKRRGEKDKVTFSKPEEGRAVSDLKRARTSPSISKAMLPPVSAAPGMISRQSSTMLSPGTGSETERPRPRSGSVRVLDGGHAADRAASVRADLGRTGSGGERESTRTVGKSAGGGGKRERRGTLVDL
ncbi:hypothetical protein BDZ89DRAFT_1055108 [Hymenopellis radicata]|nr:hypothetical protein BDZ89DRAFT_1055108 [Hymenopellis radicata]